MRADFRNISGAAHLVSFISKNELESVFEEVTKLAKIVVTIPMTTSEAERCFSTLKRIKTFLRPTMKEDRLTALAINMISIKKEMISKTPGFLDIVIDEFCSRKERRVDFQYRK